MKIKEAVNIINSTKTVRASLEKEKIYFCEYTVSKFDYFLVMPQKANNWDNVDEDFEALYSITPKDLARVMDVIQRLLDTPVKERFSEKKYVLSAMRCVEGPVPVKQYVDAMNISTNNVEFHFGFANEKANAMKFTQEDLDGLSGFFPKDAIDAMKEPAEDKND
ncbi:hypothetical protein [Limosilactobacillus reuteri]|uniref:hypothetical protein n=1 Tax=Limosilactobacillus reuteri TaxID=1598 RepID=UPI00128C3738|nr:hypothetical protein [Limosilactobacillus reuteri]MQB90337.1 hypothetical protein [Limosilactobacillus reuteri]